MFGERTNRNPTPKRGEGDYPKGPLVNLIEIKQKDIHSVPEVWYKGERMGGLQNVEFQWQTRKLSNNGKSRVSIKHVCKDAPGVGILTHTECKE